VQRRTPPSVYPDQMGDGRIPRLVDAPAAPSAERIEYADLETPPHPEAIVHQTFCGT